MGLRDFYKQMYGDDHANAPELPYIYRKLSRSEVSRYALAYRYAPGKKLALDRGCAGDEVWSCARQT